MAGYMFSNDVIKALEKHGSEMVNSVMQRAEAVYSNYGRSVTFSSHNFYDFLRIQLIENISMYYFFTDKRGESGWMWRSQGCDMWYSEET